MIANDPNEDTLKVLKDIVLPFLQDGTIIPIISNSFRIEQIFQADPELRESLKKEAKYYDDASTLEQQLTKLWSATINYPMSDDRNLARVAQYLQIAKQDTELPKIEYINLINDRLLKLSENDPGYKDKVAELRARIHQNQRLIFSETAQKLEYPRGSPAGRPDPLELLASLDLPIFITTSYSNFLEAKLEKLGKPARTQLCFWDGNKVGINPEHLPDPKFNPTPQNPAVYHLFGMEPYMDTIVLSEDDYINFLITAAEGFASQDLYPSPLRLALPTARLILIGYNLREWDFRALFRFLLMARKTAKKKKKSIAIQLRPVLGNQDYQMNSEKYLEQFFDDHDFTVVWNNPDEFIYNLIDAKNAGKSQP
ncbi:MAG TPA: SIR2 family protein [Anaerolineales bacterium]|nr:SIR2 family protein [Anaerolineales bacterium]